MNSISLSGYTLFSSSFTYIDYIDTDYIEYLSDMEESKWIYKI